MSENSTGNKKFHFTLPIDSNAFQNLIQRKYLQSLPSRSGRVVHSAVLAACGTEGHGFEARTSTNACGHVCRYVDQKGSAAMLTSIQSAGVTPEVNLIALHAGDKAWKRGIHPGFETQRRHYQKSKTGVSVAPRKGLISSQNLKKKFTKLKC